MALEQVAAIKTQLVEAGNALTLMGGPFEALALSGEAAVLAVSGLVGGIDQLIAKAQGFMANYYTEQEQAAVVASSLVQALSKAGFTEQQIAALQQRQDFRALLESIDLSTTLGQEQFASLLNLQGQFADVQTYLDAQNVTLQELALAAPQVALLQIISDNNLTATDKAVTQAQESIDKLTSVDTGIGKSNELLVNLDNTMKSGLDDIANATDRAMDLANSAIATANASAARAIAVAQSMSQPEIPVFANGGSYNGGMALVGENGPELIDFNRSGTVYTAPQTASMIGGDVAGEIRALREEVSLLRYEARATAVNTSKMSRLQDNWDIRGLTVKTDVDQPLDTVAV
jgi:hypothetical protein